MAGGVRPTAPDQAVFEFVSGLPVRQNRDQGFDPDAAMGDCAGKVSIAPPAGGARKSDRKCERMASAGNVLGPPEKVQPAAIYKLYRGATGEVHGHNSRVWVDFPSLQLCWALYDLPATVHDRLSLLDLSQCTHRPTSEGQHAGAFFVDVYGQASGVDTSADGQGAPRGLRSESGAVFRPPGRPGRGAQAQHRDSARKVLVNTSQPPPSLTVVGAAGNDALREFAEALVSLLASRDSEGRRGLEFIQKRLFQYLWMHSGTSFNEEQLYEAQAVLAFNLEPRQGVAYLRGKLGKGTDAEVGEWLAQMSTLKGGLDPTMLGTYFSRRDTLEVFKSFVRCLDFRNSDLVAALRLLFDTFKPGGEGQVITRILEMFAEAYFVQWVSHKDVISPRTAYSNPESVEQVAVSLIMLNTGLHVAPKKNAGKRITGAIMTAEEYIQNTRRVVGPEQVPEEALRAWYEAVKQAEISVEPLPRAAFSKLPVQPDIEGWLVAVERPQVQHRYWAVLALQRLYLFSDSNEVEPADAIDLKDAKVVAVHDDRACKERFLHDLHSAKTMCMCFAPKGRADLPDADMRAFEVTIQATKGPALLQKLTKPRTRLALVAESADLMEKWVSLISDGPY